jgi:hypothetical protein
MKMRWLAVLALALAMAAPAMAQGPGEKGKPAAEKGKEKEKGAEKAKEKGRAAGGDAAKEKAAEEAGEAAREAAARELRGYHSRSGGRPAELPPGIAKNLQRGKPLPAGIQRSKVPEGLASKLPRRPGEEWSLVGDRLVSVDKTGVVREVITP